MFFFSEVLRKCDGHREREQGQDFSCISPWVPVRCMGYSDGEGVSPKDTSDIVHTRQGLAEFRKYIFALPVIHKSGII